jgi:hypothetical protein
MSIKEIWKFADKNVTVKCKNGSIVSGVVTDFIDAINNTPEVDCFIIEQKITGALIQIDCSEVLQISEI